MRTVLATASGVIGNSQATLDELAKFAAAENRSLPPSTAAWLGCTELSRRGRKAQEAETPTFIALGTIEGRKNHLLLLEIWSSLVARLGDQAPRLLVIGQRGWQADRVFDIIDRDKTLRGHVVELNDCSDQDLAAHLATARAVLFPSRAEGFGLPIVEALSTGVPVIASDLPIFHEIGQGVPALVSIADASAWESAILDYARPESAERAAQLSRLRHFRPFHWVDHFRMVDQFLETLGHSSGVPSSTEPAS
jgi:glycosyltransferase involved in cell wall biosynthesis